MSSLVLIINVIFLKFTVSINLIIVTTITLWSQFLGHPRTQGHFFSPTLLAESIFCFMNIQGQSDSTKNFKLFLIVSRKFPNQIIFSPLCFSPFSLLSRENLNFSFGWGLDSCLLSILMPWAHLSLAWKDCFSEVPYFSILWKISVSLPSKDFEHDLTSKLSIRIVQISSKL